MIDLFVLDALANDLEDLESILRILNSSTELGWRDQHSEPFTRDEIIPAVFRGIREGNIEACMYAPSQNALVGLGERVLPGESLDDAWFRLTARGRIVLNSWDPPLPPDDPGLSIWGENTCKRHAFNLDRTREQTGQVRDIAIEAATAFPCENDLAAINVTFQVAHISRPWGLILDYSASGNSASSECIEGADVPISFG